MIPVEQTCPTCRCRFVGSDMVGFECPSCQGINPKGFAEAIAAMNQMYYQEETDGRPSTD